MQISVFFSFLVYTESEHTITTNPRIVKQNLGFFIKIQHKKTLKTGDYTTKNNDNFFIST